jgi:hypothetical protein
VCFGPTHKRGSIPNAGGDARALATSTAFTSALHLETDVSMPALRWVQRQAAPLVEPHSTMRQALQLEGRTLSAP